MESSDALIHAANRSLERPMKLPHQASAIALKLFLLADVLNLSADPRIINLRKTFDDALHEAGFEDLLGHQLRYASRLAGSPGTLLYEEMHKLFSLLDEIHALRSLGFGADEAIIREFESDVRARFAAQPRDSRLVAEDKAEEWSRPLWWYAENLST